MNQLTELGTARGFAGQAVDRAERELKRARAEYEIRCEEYRQYFVDLRSGNRCPWHNDQSVECERCRGATNPT
jgi:hypothetical protein